jgi:hypothetical protein
MNTINFSKDSKQAEPFEPEWQEYNRDPKTGLTKGLIEAPEQVKDDNEYMCHHYSAELAGANPGRDQDTSRIDEYQGATPFARYNG